MTTFIRQDFEHKCYDCNRKIKGSRYLVKRNGKGEYVCEDCMLEDEDYKL